MLSEEDARDLLMRAASTIDVPPSSTVTLTTSPPPRRLLPPLVAAAVAVVALIVGIALVRHDRTPDSRPTKATATPTDSPATTGVPSVFAYDADAAEKLLVSDGLTVTRKLSYTCMTQGRAVKTSPSAGTPFEAGDSVTLFVTGPSPNVRCIRPALDAVAWQLLDFANRRGPAPHFAPVVTVYLNEQATTMTGAEAAAPGTWDPDSALGVLAAATRQETSGGPNAAPALEVRRDAGDDFLCGRLATPDSLADRRSLWLSVAFPTTDLDPLPCTFANVYRTDQGIDAIVVRHHGTG